MLEIIHDIATLWFSITIMLMVVAAFTRANVFYVKCELKANWKSKMLVDSQICHETTERLIPSIEMIYRPKVPARLDHHGRNRDDEDPFVVFIHS